MCPETKLSSSFSMGYKNMCHFWSIGFLEYLKNYHYIIRIDEDCFLDKMDSNIINQYISDKIYFSSPFHVNDDNPDVIIGLDNLVENFIRKNNIEKQSETLWFPYTNMMIVDVSYFSKNENVLKLLQEIDDSDCIFNNRWGDLPIWGYILTYLIPKENYFENKSIKYYHSSHHSQINGG
jgi:hypothetical protein